MKKFLSFTYCLAFSVVLYAGIGSNFFELDSTTCLDTNGDRIYHDTNCDHDKDAGEEYIDQTGGSGGGYDVEPSTITFLLDKGVRLSTGNITSLSPGPLKLAAGTSNFYTAQISASTDIASGILPTTVIASSVQANAIFAGQMGNSDHGDVSWTSNVATVDNVAAANVAAGSLGSSVLASSFPASGATAGTYGSATQVSSVTIDAQGRVTRATNVTISISTTNMNLSGTASATTFARGDNSWATPAGGSADNLGNHVATMTLTTGFGVNSTTITVSQNAQFTSVAAPATNVEGNTWNDSTRKAYMGYIDGIKQVFSGTVFASTTTQTFSNTTTTTTLLGVGPGTLTLPANFFTNGKALRIHASGVYSTDFAAPGNFIFYVRLGSVEVGVTANRPLLGNAANQGWYLDFMLTCRTTGASGTVFGQGRVSIDASAATEEIWPMANSTTQTVDTTTALVVDVMGQFDSAAAANSISGTNAYVEVLN